MYFFDLRLGMRGWFTRRRVLSIAILGFIAGLLLVPVRYVVQEVESHLDFYGVWIMTEDGAVYRGSRSAIGDRVVLKAHPGNSEYDIWLGLYQRTRERFESDDEGRAQLERVVISMPERMKPVWDAMWLQLDEQPGLTGEVVVIGWPFRCFRGGCLVPDTGSPVPPSEVIMHTSVLDIMPQSTGRAREQFVYGPLWLGLGGNWLTLFGVLWLVVAVVKLAARAIPLLWRRRRGACVKCGYGKSGVSGACPECGWPFPESTQSISA